jgi:hypothetical protein
MKPTLKLWPVLIAILSTLGSCIWEDDGYWIWPTWDDNWAPYVVTADAGCFWDPATREDVWYFEAEVDDYDGWRDIVAVEAHVYDDWHGDDWVDGFSLEETAYAWTWYAEYPERHTNLDCYYDRYTVVFYVWDYFDEMGALEVYPHTYSDAPLGR